MVNIIVGGFYLFGIDATNIQLFNIFVFRYIIYLQLTGKDIYQSSIRYPNSANLRRDCRHFGCTFTNNSR
jgi:hypothetical protein